LGSPRKIDRQAAIVRARGCRSRSFFEIAPFLLWRSGRLSLEDDNMAFAGKVLWQLSQIAGAEHQWLAGLGSGLQPFHPGSETGLHTITRNSSSLSFLARPPATPLPEEPRICSGNSRVMPQFPGALARFQQTFGHRHQARRVSPNTPDTAARSHPRTSDQSP
jgi:hypothetical protein